MILRKPYAFLIKNFKLIHLILVVLMCFLLYKSYNIYNFLQASVANNYSAIMTGEVAGELINYFMYGGVLLILFLLIAIYYLLSHKNKPRKFYLYTILYYVILFAFFTIYYSFIYKLTNEVVTTAALRSYRDISIIALLPQPIFIVYCMVSALGFNIKKFNFGEDLKELEIEDADNEEFEFTFGANNYKRQRKIRRTIREFKYYVIENKFIFTIICVIAGIIIVSSIFFNREVYNKDFKLNSSIGVQYFTINIQDSIVSPFSYDGEVIEEGKYYLAIKLAITNNTTLSQKLNYSNFRLIVNGNSIKPDVSLSQKFIDYASMYLGGNVKGKASQVISLVYKLDKKQLADNYTLKIYKGSKIDAGEIKSSYSEIHLAPVIIDTITDANDANLNEKLTFNYSNVGNTYITIKSFQFTNSYVYSYKDCPKNDPENCRTLDQPIAVDATLPGKPKTLLVMDYDAKFDEEMVYCQNYPSMKNFVDNFLKIKYFNDGEEPKYSKAYYKDAPNAENKLILQVDNEIKQYSNVDLVFTVRNKNYIVHLK